MKVKTSITLEDSLLAELDKRRDGQRSRSDLIEIAVREYLMRRERAERYAREIELMERHADVINAEAEDVLSYQEW